MNSGLNAKADNEAELAGGMAHEIAHVALDPESLPWRPLVNEIVVFRQHTTVDNTGSSVEWCAAAIFASRTER